MKITATHPKEQGLLILARNLAPAALSTAPGLFGAGGRPHPSPFVRYYSCLVEKAQIPVSIYIGDEKPEAWISDVPSNGNRTTNPNPNPNPIQRYTPKPLQKDFKTVNNVPLFRVAYGRSGDKGDCANIGIVARTPEIYEYLLENLTEEVVQSYMGHLIKGSVKRYQLPGISGLNFVLTKSLGGGGTQSLTVDTQGKAYAQMLLTLPLKSCPAHFLSAFDPVSNL